MKFFEAQKIWFLRKLEERFFKKHKVSDWREYNLKYDPDYEVRGDTIRQMFFGYPYIAEISDPEVLDRPNSRTDEDGYTYLKNWLEHECRGKTRSTLEQVISTVTYRNGYKQRDWSINGIGGYTALYVAFQDERDYLMFLLKWETS